MRTHLVQAAILCIGMIPGLALAEAPAIEIGKQEYMIACGGCHGESALGDGPMATHLNMETPNLTQLSANNGGEFPFQYAVWMIDGREFIRLHGGPDMPIWGDRFTASAQGDGSVWVTPEAAEVIAMGRILALVNYLESIQQ